MRNVTRRPPAVYVNDGDTRLVSLAVARLGAKASLGALNGVSAVVAHAFVPPALEMAVLGAALAGAIGTLLRDGLPRFHHPLVGIARFERASCDRFFLCIRASDPHFKAEATRRFLEDLAPEEMAEVAIP